MGLGDRPDFREWLTRFEARHVRLHGDAPPPRPERCDGCGEPIAAPVSSTGLCLVCLAEAYGRDRSRSAARVAAALEAAIADERGTPIGDIREAVEGVLNRLEEVA